MDCKDFTHYPPSLMPKFRRVRARKTYMKKTERFKPGFLRPKHWFRKEDWKKIKKVKIFGLTCSNGCSWAVQCPTPWNQKAFAKLIKELLI